MKKDKDGSKQNIKKLGHIIKEKREEEGLSIRGLGRESGLQGTTIMRLEKGEKTSPSPIVLGRLAGTLSISLAELYTLAGYPVPDNLPDVPGYVCGLYGEDVSEKALDEVTEFFRNWEKQHHLNRGNTSPAQ